MRVAIDCRKIADFGIGTYVRGLVRGLAELDVPEDFVLLVPRRLEDLPRRFEQVVVEAKNYSVRELHEVPRVLGRVGAAAYHNPHYVLPWSSRPGFVTIHDVIQINFPPSNPVARAYVSTMIPRALRKSAAVFTVTEAARQSIIATFDCDPAKIVVTPNGIDEIFWSDAIAPASLGRYLLFVGNDKPHKNVGRLIEAFEQVRAGDRSLQLVLVGAQFDRFASHDGVVTAGFVPTEELVALYRGALALVMPSLEEGFGLPAVEAMAAGTPVIASDIPSLAEVCGDAALRFDPGSVAAIASAISRITSDESLRGALRARGTIVARRYTWRRCAELTRAGYLAALAS